MNKSIKINVAKRNSGDEFPKCCSNQLLRHCAKVCRCAKYDADLKTPALDHIFKSEICKSSPKSDANSRQIAAAAMTQTN